MSWCPTTGSLPRALGRFGHVMQVLSRAAPSRWAQAAVADPSCLSRPHVWWARAATDPGAPIRMGVVGVPSLVRCRYGEAGPCAWGPISPHSLDREGRSRPAPGGSPMTEVRPFHTGSPPQLRNCEPVPGPESAVPVTAAPVLNCLVRAVALVDPRFNRSASPTPVWTRPRRWPQPACSPTRWLPPQLSCEQGGIAEAAETSTKKDPSTTRSKAITERPQLGRSGRS
jgi:hypothetical protein